MKITSKNFKKHLGTPDEAENIGKILSLVEEEHKESLLEIDFTKFVKDDDIKLVEDLDKAIQEYKSLPL